ncbi:MAG: UDP-N-acetylmuramoyl-tripeptide--D-alanyl-D-alanine ligase [Eubacteriales bacterium]
MIKTAVYTSKEIADALGAKLYGKDVQISGITTDSREFSHDPTCFFALKGENFNGADFIEEACANGAELIVTDREIALPVSVIYVEDVKKAFCNLAKYHKGKTKIIGVTGSVGKTTVKDMIKAVLSEKYSVCATYSNNNNEIGVAQTLFSIRDEEYCVVEMGMRGTGEIEFLSEICEPDTAVITNAGSAHIERLGSRENIFCAKAEILNNTKKFAIVPGEQRFRNLDYGNIKPCFVGEGGDFAITEPSYTETGIKFGISEKIPSGNAVKKTDIALNSFGIHNAQNAAFAYAAGRVCGMEAEDIKSGLLKYKSEKMRESLVETGTFSMILDCYNASYEGMKSALISLCEYAKIKNLAPYAMLGDMLEVGDFAREYHYRIGEFARDLGIKNIFVLGENAKYLTDGFCGGVVCRSVRDASRKIKSSLEKGDVILVKASRGMHFEKIVDFMKEM